MPSTDERDFIELLKADAGAQDPAEFVFGHSLGEKKLGPFLGKVEKSEIPLVGTVREESRGLFGSRQRLFFFWGGALL